MTSTPSKAAAGPWHIPDVSWEPWEGAIEIVNNDGDVICYTSSGRGREKADAALIAAAPDLLAALKNIRLLVFGTYSADHAALNDVLEGRDAEVLKQVDAAISRATGEA